MSDIGLRTEMSWYNSPIRIVERKLNVIRCSDIRQNENTQQQNFQMQLLHSR